MYTKRVTHGEKGPSRPWMREAARQIHSSSQIPQPFIDSGSFSVPYHLFDITGPIRWRIW